MKQHRAFDALWVAITMAAISGYINAYTYNTQGGRFAGAQTGNLIFLGLHLAQGNWDQVWNYALPITVFSLGQFLIHYLKVWRVSLGRPYHLMAVAVMMGLLLVISLTAPLVESHVTISALALFSSFQVEVFKRIGSIQYANVMMTGNVKAGAYLLAEGLSSGNPLLIRQGLEKVAVLLSFVSGVILSHHLSAYLHEHGLLLLLLPLALVYQVIRRERIELDKQKS